MNYEEAYNHLLIKYKATVAELNRVREIKNVFEQVLLHSKRSVAVIDMNLKITWVNTKAVDMFGFAFEELEGKKISEMIFGSETDVSMVPQALEDAYWGRTAAYDQLVYRKDGSKLWIHVELRPVYNQKKEVYKICLYGDDITQERELKRKVDEGERRHQYLLQHTNEIVYSIDLTGKIIYVNEAWNRILGYSNEETLWQLGNHFFHPDDIEKAKAARQTIIDGTAFSYNIDVRVIAKDGNTVWLNTTSVPVYDSVGELIGFSGMSKDITKYVRETQIQELLAKYSRSMISMNDKDTNYEYVSPSFKELTGWSYEELIGKRSFDYYHPDDISRIHEYRDKNIRGEILDDENIELRYLKKDGTYAWIEITARWFFDPYNESNKTIITAQLVDRRKRDEAKMIADLEEAKKLNQLKTNFLQFVSHEFKTPLSIIKALCELIDMSIEDDAVQLPQLKKDIVGIDNEVTGLVDLIEDVLILEELESGKVQLRFKGLDVESVVRNVNDRLSYKIGKREKAQIKVVGKPQSVPGDNKYLELIFRNLLSNAYKYSEGRPTPIVTIHFFDNQCVVCVKDFGIGIPEEDSKKLFDNFYRASNVGNIEGTGLGLNLVKRFVEMHGGNIVCVSKVNEGTEMYVSFKVVSESE